MTWCPFMLIKNVVRFKIWICYTCLMLSIITLLTLKVQKEFFVVNSSFFIEQFLYLQRAAKNNFFHQILPELFLWPAKHNVFLLSVLRVQCCIFTFVFTNYVISLNIPGDIEAERYVRIHRLLVTLLLCSNTKHVNDK